MGEGWRQSRKEEDDGFEEGDEVDDSLRLNFCCELQAAGVDLDTRGSARERPGSGRGRSQEPWGVWAASAAPRSARGAGGGAHGNCRGKETLLFDRAHIEPK